MALAAVLVLVGLALLGAPLFAVIAAGAFWGFHAEAIDLTVVAIELHRIAESPVLVAIPLFTFAGYLLSEGQAPGRLVQLTRAWLGWMPGGLAVVTLLACALFTAFTGATGVTIVALGALLLPALVQTGYREDFSLGLVTASGSLGLLFAPSLPLILYGVIVQQQGVGRPIALEELFLAGILPGLLMIGLLAAFSLWQARHQPLRPFAWRAARAALWQARWDLPLPFVVLGGIYGGVFVVSEAAAVTVLYVLIAECLLYREIPPRALPRIMREAMVVVGGILVILGASLALTNYLIDIGVPTRLFELMQAHVDSRLAFLMVLNLFLLVVGAMIDIFAALVLMVPLLLPVAVGYGVDPVHLGIIVLANLGVGYLTPPVGLNLFMASLRFGRPILELYRVALPFFLIMLVAVLVITYWPGLSLALLG